MGEQLDGQTSRPFCAPQIDKVSDYRYSGDVLLQGK